MNSYNRLVGAIFIFLGIKTLVVIVILQIGFSLALFTDIEMELHHLSLNWSQVYNFLRIVFLICVLLISIPSLVAGVGLFNNKEWAKKIAMVLSLFYLFFFPVGTVLALVSLILLFHENTQGKKNADGAEISQLQ